MVQYTQVNTYVNHMQILKDKTHMIISIDTDKNLPENSTCIHYNSLRELELEREKIST